MKKTETPFDKFSKFVHAVAQVPKSELTAPKPPVKRKKAVRAGKAQRRASPAH